MTKPKGTMTMQSIDIRHDIMKHGSIGFLGLAFAALVGCLQGETTSTTGTVSPGGSAALQGPLVFVNNMGARTLTTVAVRGDSGNSVVNTLGPGVFGNVALG